MKMYAHLCIMYDNYTIPVPCQDLNVVCARPRCRIIFFFERYRLARKHWFIIKTFVWRTSDKKVKIKLMTRQVSEQQKTFDVLVKETNAQTICTTVCVPPSLPGNVGLIHTRSSPPVHHSSLHPSCCQGSWCICVNSALLRVFVLVRASHGDTCSAGFFKCSAVGLKHHQDCRLQDWTQKLNQQTFVFPCSSSGWHPNSRDYRACVKSAYN